MTEPVHTHAVVFAGGGEIDPRVVPLLPDGAFLIAADSGFDDAAAVGVTAQMIVGDMDSISAESLDRASATGINVQRHQVDKDATDLELALAVALDTGATNIMVIGGGAGRLDHLISGALLLASDTYADVGIEGYFGSGHAMVVRSAAELIGRRDELVSLLAVGGIARGVRSRGLRFALAGEDLHPGSTRGISNEFVAADASLSVTSGTILVIQPDRLGQARIPRVI